MASKKKLLQAAAGSAGGAALDIPDVFSTYLYTGTGSTETVTNNIDLSGEGGMVWIKDRSVGTAGTGWHNLYDTERGTFKMLHTHETGNEYNGSPSRGISSFNSDGFTINEPFHGTISGNNYVSWTFRKAPKFFDIQTWSGTSSTRTISHNLGCTPGMIIIKSYDSNATNWMVWHNSLTNTATKFMYLNNTDQEASYGSTAIAWGDTAPTSTEFTVGSATFNNETGKNYVAYIFAHNNSDGEFGPDQDQDIIKCGAYTGNGGVLDVNLGFEAGWVLVKKRDNSGTDWHLFDAMRGMPFGADASWLEANTYNQEASNAYMSSTSTGFRLPDGHPEVNTSGDGYIYMAIRTGFLNTPDDVDAIWSADTALFTTPAFQPNFNADMVWVRRPSQIEDMKISARLMQSKFNATTTTAVESAGSFYKYDYQDAWGSSPIGSTYRGWSWRRGKGFLDVVSYTGNGSSNTINHNLGVVPEMIVTKKRTGGTASWAVVLNDYNSGLGYLKFNETDALAATTYNVHPNRTATSYGLNNDGITNNSGHTYIAYLFASLDGISKVGTWTGTNPLAYQTIDCGFSSSARFILIKRLDAAGHWYLWDSVMGGISIGASDEFLRLNTTDTKRTETAEWGSNVIASASTGFRVVNDLNEVGHEYMFYAIA